MNLHIIALNIPYPPDYGGMIDTYYRIKALHNLGVLIHLHCFEYGRQHSNELESLCESTTYYERNISWSEQFSVIPYIVSSRKAILLPDNLERDDYPILFDGLHSTYCLNHQTFTNRRKLVRLHNIEHKYYLALSHNEPNLLRKGYYLLESAKLRNYEKVLQAADYILPLSAADQEYFSKKYHNSVLLPPFHPYNEPEILSGTGEYVIYHGDLSINENSVIAGSLIKNIFSRIPYKFVIAGKDPPEFIKLLASRYRNISVVSNPDHEHMAELIANAHIHLLPALTSSGFKIKLLMALYAGRHCIVNSVIGEDPLIKNLCHIADSDSEIINKIESLMEEPFTDKMIHEREKVLSENFDIVSNAKKLIKML
jgi:glycosyltransferase involved in cell wall biosynthesis